jgi:hypothetical protein
MRQHIAAVAAAAALAISGLVANAGPASADVPCTITGFTPTTVVVGLAPVTRTFNVRTSGCTRGGWDLLLGNYEAFVFDGAPQETFQPSSNTDAGSHSAVATAYNSAYLETQRSWASAFHLKRASTWGSTFNAGPEPVTATRAITVQGKLSLANWDTGRYGIHRYQDVKVQFRTPTGTYATVKTIRTDYYGWAKTTVTAQRTGYWRLVYGGNSISGPVATVGDSVQVTSPIQLGRIQYNSPGSDQATNVSVNGEYVTLKNLATTTRSLTGWTVRDTANHVYTFGTFALGAGKSVTLRTGKGTNTSSTRYWGRGSHVWNNTVGKAYLRDAAGTGMDSCGWAAGGPGYKSC